MIGFMMFYVIQRINQSPEKTFLAYKIPKFITSEKNNNVIFEYTVNNEVKRKWAPKHDIIVLTRNKKFFEAVKKRLENKQNEHVEEIKSLESQLEERKEIAVEEMNKEMDAIMEWKHSNKKSPCLLT